MSEQKEGTSSFEGKWITMLLSIKKHFWREHKAKGDIWVFHNQKGKEGALKLWTRLWKWEADCIWRKRADKFVLNTNVGSVWVSCQIRAPPPAVLLNEVLLEHRLIHLFIEYLWPLLVLWQWGWVVGTETVDCRTCKA